uniref:Transmembrane protein 176A n=1 Tax=Catagonus wagneri TaxID=51154 RepID=A0A8C3X5S8_9CETA
MGALDGGEAGPGAPQRASLEVHIHQESGLAKLLLSGCSLLRPLVPQPRTASRTPGGSQLLVASWVVQIVLGVMSAVLGGFLYVSYSTALRASGAPIWTGAVAVLAGAVAFIYEKRGGAYWALLKTLLALTAPSTAIAAVIIAATNFNEYRFSFPDNICDVSPSWGPTWPPGTPSPDISRQQLCTFYLDMLKAQFIGLRAILLGVWVLLLLASLVPLCLCCWRKYRQKEVSPSSTCLLGGRGQGAVQGDGSGAWVVWGGGEGQQSESQGTYHSWLSFPFFFFFGRARAQHMEVPELQLPPTASGATPDT